MRARRRRRAPRWGRTCLATIAARVKAGGFFLRLYTVLMLCGLGFLFLGHAGPSGSRMPACANNHTLGGGGSSTECQS
jgi:hypothetical protein